MSADLTYGTPMKIQLGAGCRNDAWGHQTRHSRTFCRVSGRITTHRMERAASNVALYANGPIHDARAAVVRSWPRCPSCPVPAPAKQRESDKIVAAVLDALVAHAGGPLSTSDLMALGVGLDRNNSKSIMEGLVAGGSVILTRDGPTKFYSLP